MSDSFQQLDLRTDLCESLARFGIARPTAIQTEAIPVVMQGRDLIARSHTGTGKTLAYLAPIMHTIDMETKEPQAVIIVPTQELGVQIAAEIEKFGADLGIRGLALIGGAAIGRQIEKLRSHPQIVVGTPGRLEELIRMRKLKMHKVRTIVADEADQLFKLGSVKELESVIASARRDRQLLFFSATMPEEVRKTARRWMKEPVVLDADPEIKTAATIEHLLFVCGEREKHDTLRRLIRMFDPKRALVFVNDLDRIAEVASKLRYSGLAAEALYGDAPKKERANLLSRFRRGKVQVLVATDLAARGLDIEDLTHVFHFEPAIDPDHYVHRAGRTGRMGQSGMSVSIATEKELFIIRKFEAALGIKIQRKEMYKGALIDPEERPKAQDRGRERIGLRKRPDQPLEQAKSAAIAEPLRAKTAQIASVRSKGKPAERERDRKNKGAPRWLKEKAKQSNQQRP
jgi:superfamily II DNA/RNA helicase